MTKLEIRDFDPKKHGHKREKLEPIPKELIEEANRQLERSQREQASGGSNGKYFICGEDKF